MTCEKMGDVVEPSQLYEAVVWVSVWFLLQEKLEWQSSFLKKSVCEISPELENLGKKYNV